MLSGPISRDTAIVSLRYPLSRDTFSAISAIPQQGAIPPLGAFFYTDISVRYPILQHIARYLCDTPGKQARKSLAILSLQVSCDMKSIASGPLRLRDTRPIPTPWLFLLSRQSLLVFCPAARRPPRAEPFLNGPYPKPQQQQPKKIAMPACRPKSPFLNL